MESRGQAGRQVKRIEQKWGFGLAPIKPNVQRGRVEAARTVLAAIAQGHLAALGRLDDLSTIKGLFTRTYKKDQWDWFTVCAQLGYPSRKEARQASGTLQHLRRCLRDANWKEATAATAALELTGVPDRLRDFATGTSAPLDGRGFVYVLSTREAPEMLKIGYTNRDPLTRAKEINSATGVIIPWGVRGAWSVAHAHRIEADIHALLADYRVRKDREFFNMPFTEAADAIEKYVTEAR
ncbi:GIY-YIG nuclease family protein [Streptomyces sp. RY43-2]|uniref:GIY-YIG nuclease family protein n=1 Tax=Streptomyces macrolidinus TaxID=2952607 RepID=A0ABT0ZI15_9ACTN|nr:GIY-YIG nuclease family protein [Streptomyces macrolidinus]MCN9243230.1 GIY-YIG nuclease family protein [Streptomyces macrolidinus]